MTTGKEAGDAFVQSADCLTKAQSRHEAATNFVQAANCYRKVNARDAVEKLQEAVSIFTELGRFSIAAKHQKEIAEIYERCVSLSVVSFLRRRLCS